MLAVLLFTILERAILTRPQAVDWYAMLLQEGGYGRLQYERAAFLIEETDGTLTLQPWDGGGFRHARFEGAVPKRTVAILHTHPAGDRRPSANDVRLARRLGIPVVVITPDAVTAADRSGRVESLLTGWNWNIRTQAGR